MNSKKILTAAIVVAAVAIFLALVGVLFLGGIYKPVIYFYSERPIAVTATITTDELLTHSEPGSNVFSPATWTFLALPNSVLVSHGKQYPYLFYETSYFGKRFSLNEGWSVERSELIPLLNEKLPLLGLSKTETNAFVEYWSTRLPESKYYSICVIDRKEIDEKIKLDVNPTPDSVIRVFLAFKPTQSNEVLKLPRITPSARNGFAVVEWGGFIV